MQHHLAGKVQEEVDRLGVETDGNGWRAKVFLYCLETRCTESGWKVPLLPSRIVSKGYGVVADLVPDAKNRRYDIIIRSGVSAAEVAAADKGTLRTDGRGQDPYLLHTVAGRDYRTKITTLRGDFRNQDGATGNKLRPWVQSDFMPRQDDIFQERLYCIQWMQPKPKGTKFDYEFRSVTGDDLKREHTVAQFVGSHLAEWQQNGWVPDMRI